MVVFQGCIEVFILLKAKQTNIFTYNLAYNVFGFFIKT